MVVSLQGFRERAAIPTLSDCGTAFDISVSGSTMRHVQYANRQFQYYRFPTDGAHVSGVSEKLSATLAQVLVIY